MHLNIMELETVTTIPVLPLDHPAFLDEVLQDPRSHRRPRRVPLWASVCVYVGGALSVGVGAFFITMGMLGLASW